MAKRPSPIRTQTERVYTLTNELQVQLKRLEEAHTSVRIQIKPVANSSLEGADIGALAFLVLMQAAKSAQEDLKAIMDKVKTINDAKQKQREMLNKVQAITGSAQTAHDPESVLQVMLTTYVKQIDAEAQALFNEVGSLNELGEEEILRLQALMDRLSKMMSVLSNVMKKLSDTSNQIVQNLK